MVTESPMLLLALLALIINYQGGSHVSITGWGTNGHGQALKTTPAQCWGQQGSHAVTPHLGVPTSLKSP